MKALRPFLGIILAMVTAVPAMGADTVGSADPDNGQWTMRAPNGNTKVFAYGVPGDSAFSGDWDCDGVDTPGLYRRSTGLVYLRNSNGTGVADLTFIFGNPGDIPVAGDFNGDGCDTVSIYRPSESRFYIIDRLGPNGGVLGPAEYAFYYGVPGDVPVVGDWDGNGVDNPGLRRPSDGFVYLRNSNSQGFADLSFFYGNPGDVPIAGDWDGDGDDTMGLFRPSEATFYLANTNATVTADIKFQMGDSNSMPLAGDFDLNLPPPPPPLRLATIATGMQNPLYVAAPPGDSRLFVVEQVGHIEIIENGSKRSTPFLDIEGPVTCCGERGLLGLAFHPDYASNGKFYVNYTAGLTTRISEFTVSADPNRADHGSERVILSLSQPATNHNGGMLFFDEDGFLIIPTGDGGGAGDPNRRAQNRNDLLGKILRIDVDKTEAGRQYGIPPGNPFAAGGGAPEVYMIGVRNPWRVADYQGYFYVADVGQGSREELTILSAGAALANLGWNAFEGTSCFAGPCNIGGYTFPQIEYSHPAGCSITGGFVYRGSAIPGLVGTYFYGDFCTSRIHSLTYAESIVSKHVDRTPELGSVSQLSSFGYDGQGELYITSLGGSVYRIVAAP